MQRLPPLLHGQAATGRHRRAARALRAPLRPAEGQEVAALDERRRQALLGVKLTALVRDHTGAEGGELGSFRAGATLARGSTGWVLTEDPERSLGAALAWALRHGVEEVHLLVEDPPADEVSGHLARRASAFAGPPKPAVWRVVGRTLAPAVAQALPPQRPVAPEVADLAEVIRRVGAEPVVEHGVLRAEVLGLEVGRVVEGESGPVLEVGVGKHDRDAHREVHGGPGGVAALASTVAAVLEYRRPGVLAHPANQLGRERWLRRVVIEHPGLVGAASLVPLPSPVPRRDLRAPVPAPAAGFDAAGQPMLVVCSVGVDLELVPVAADARLAWLGGSQVADARLVLTVPEGDDVSLTREMAGLLADPAQVVTVPRQWEGATASD